MKTLYIDCGMGAAGDMLTAALMDMLSEKERAAFEDKIASLNIPGLKFERTDATKCGIKGSHVSVHIFGEEEQSEDFHDHEHHHDHDHDHEHHHDHEHDHHHDHEHDHDHEHHHDHHHHHHTSLADVHAIVGGFNVSDKVKEDVKNVYGLIAEAESNAHGKPVEEIHFHEVGSLDAVTDVTAVCLLMEQLGAEKIVASPVHVGAGKVRCAHGVLPVPAPATAYILSGVPIYGGKIMGELCTPTGAALLKYFVDDFGDMPVMSVNKIGYGMGNKDFEVANCVRVMLGDSKDGADTIVELSCNVDDMTSEEIGFALETFFDHGAADAFVTPITMKKSRPGHLISVICRGEKKQEMVELIMKHTTTLGIRETLHKRNILKREIVTVDTAYGPIRKKVSTGYGITREKYEYEDLAKVAKERNMSISEVRNSL